MRITIKGLSDNMTDDRQSEVGHAILLTLAKYNVEIDGVSVELTTGDPDELS